MSLVWAGADRADELVRRLKARWGDGQPGEPELCWHMEHAHAAWVVFSTRGPGAMPQLFTSISREIILAETQSAAISAINDGLGTALLKQAFDLLPPIRGYRLDEAPAWMIRQAGSSPRRHTISKEDFSQAINQDVIAIPSGRHGLLVRIPGAEGTNWMSPAGTLTPMKVAGLIQRAWPPLAAAFQTL